MQFFAVFLDHCQLKIFHFDEKYREIALSRAIQLSTGFAETYGANRVTIEDRYGAIVYKPDLINEVNQ